MKNIEKEYKVDRSDWRKGEWDSEPEDKRVWIDKDTNLDCMMIRNNWGAWCGYVGVPTDHPKHGRDCDDIQVSVHGGISYANKCGGHVCHPALPGRPKNVWWIGFDCAQTNDRWPSNSVSDWNLILGNEGEYPHLEYGYRNIEYVTNEVTDLAKQLSNMH